MATTSKTASPGFWASKASEAKRKYRFKLRVQMAGTIFEEWVITKVTRPSFSITDTSHSYLNHTFKFPGRVNWEDVSFSLVEPLATDSTDILMAMLYNSGYRFPSTTNSNTIAKETSIIDAFEISALNAGGSAVDKWTLRNPWISQASLGEFDYTADDLMGIDITVKYDFAMYQDLLGTGLNKLSKEGTTTPQPS